jgi:hypothetical protein
MLADAICVANKPSVGLAAPRALRGDAHRVIDRGISAARIHGGNDRFACADLNAKGSRGSFLLNIGSLISEEIRQRNEPDTDCN